MQMAALSSGYIPFPDPHNWNKVIKQQVLEGNHERALLTYINIQEIGFCADNFTYPLLLKAVGTLSLFGVGLGLHGQMIKAGFCGHAFVQTALLNLYASFGCASDAYKVFVHMPAKDMVAWNSMLDAYVSSRQMDKAMGLFDLMPCKDLLSYNIMISGYASIGSFKFAKSMFDESPERDVVSWNSMILACCNSGDMEKARILLKEMPKKSEVTWNTMLKGYLNNGFYADAICLFEEMKARNFEPDHITIAGVLSACAQSGSLDQGRKLHIYAQENGFTSSRHVTTSLIDMYAKCGSIESSLEVFYKSILKDIYCWNAIISGLALHGYGFAAFKLFDDMRYHSFGPDDITFIGLLSACSHAGLVAEGCKLFARMERHYGVAPKLEHYGCLVDLLGRAGFLNPAFQVVKLMPFKPGSTILGALLGACVNYGDLEIGEKVVKLLSKRDEKWTDGEYMMVANLYASFNHWEEASKWRGMMNDTGIVKTAGSSAIEVEGRMSKFLAGDKSMD